MIFSNQFSNQIMNKAYNIKMNKCFPDKAQNAIETER